MAFVDTNIVLRYLLGDHPQLTKKAERLIAGADARELIITDVVVAEIVYVLRVPTQKIIALNLSIGSRLPAFCTSMGRVLLGRNMAPSAGAVCAAATISGVSPSAPDGSFTFAPASISASVG